MTFRPSRLEIIKQRPEAGVEKPFTAQPGAAQPPASKHLHCEECILSTTPSVKTPPGRLPRRKRTQHCTHADAQHMVACHRDVEFYNQRSLLLLLYSFCDYLVEQLRNVFPHRLFSVFSTPSSGSLRKTRHQLVLNGHNTTTLHTSTCISFCLWHCRFTSNGAETKT